MSQSGSLCDVDLAVQSSIVTDYAFSLDVAEGTDPQVCSRPGILSDKHMMSGFNPAGKIGSFIKNGVTAYMTLWAQA